MGVSSTRHAKVVTFGGHFYHFNELKELIKYDYVFVDVRHMYGVDQHTFDGVNVVEVATDENDDKNVSIAKTVIRILETIDDDVIILDSDVYVPVERVPRTSQTAISLCIPAIDWGSKTYVLYCHSTNMYIPRLYRMTFISSLTTYLKNPSVSIDTYMNLHIPVNIKRIVIPGTFHYLPIRQGDYANTKKWVIQEGHILNVGEYAMLPEEVCIR